MNNQIELKPCPFCGGEAHIKIVGKSVGEHFRATFEIGCDKCTYYFREESSWYIKNGQIMTNKDGYNDCIKKWNRRVNNG